MSSLGSHGHILDDITSVTDSYYKTVCTGYVWFTGLYIRRKHLTLGFNRHCCEVQGSLYCIMLEGKVVVRY